MGAPPRCSAQRHVQTADVITPCGTRADLRLPLPRKETSRPTSFCPSRPLPAVGSIGVSSETPRVDAVATNALMLCEESVAGVVDGERVRVRAPCICTRCGHRSSTGGRETRASERCRPQGIGGTSKLRRGCRRNARIRGRWGQATGRTCMPKICELPVNSWLGNVELACS